MITPPPSYPAPAERWATDAGDRDVAVLTIPPDALRDRRFDVYCRFIAAARGRDTAVHGMRVEVDGALEWTRRLPTENPGHADSMDYRFRRDVPAGQALRIVVKTEVQGAQRVALSIEAEEC